MWYEDTIRKIDKDKSFTRNEIYEFLLNERPNLSYNSFKWIVSDMTKQGVLIRKQRGIYTLQDNAAAEKNIYKPHMSERLKGISMIIENRFPMVDFVCFESVQLNEFLNHLIAKNTIFFMVEKDVMDSVFRYLQDEAVGNILFKPGKKEWDAYWTGDDIVILNLVSEFPKSHDGTHGICIEQLLVDIIAEKCFKVLYSRSEVKRIYYHANKRYLIDCARLLRYARRRGKADEVKKYMEDYTDAYTG